MGSLPSPPCPALPSPPPTPSPDLLSNCRVYAVFCRREPTITPNVDNCILCYYPSTNAWSHVTSIPNLIENHVLKGFAMVALGDSIYIIGGRLCHKERACIFDEVNEFIDVGVDVVSKVMCYNVITNQWSERASLGIPRYDFACTVCDNKIYVAGGQSTLAGARGVSSAERYDPTSDEWAPLPNMSTLRYKCVGVTWQDKIHVVGGFAERGDSDRTLPYMMERSSVEVYYTEDEKWELAAGMWQLDVPPNQIVSIGDKLFSSGDCLKAWKGHIEAYDGKLNIWNEVDGSNLQNLNSTEEDENWASSKLLYLTIAPIGTDLYILAGHRMAGELSRTRTTVHVFDTSAANASWRKLEPIEEVGEKELCSHCCVVQLV